MFSGKNPFWNPFLPEKLPETNGILYMPRPNLMSWEGEPNYRWTKLYKGQRFKVTCDQLGVPRTKADSIAAANQWWQDQLSQHSPMSDPDTRSAIERRLRLIPVAENGTANKWIQEVTDLKNGIIQAGPRYFEGLPTVSIDPLQGTTKTEKAIWTDRVNRSIESAIDPDKTIGHNLSCFLKLIRSNQSITTQHEISEYLDSMTKSGKVWSSVTDVSTIAETTVNNHYLYLVEKDYSFGSHNKYLGFFRRFISWLFEQNLLPTLPRNLKSKDHLKPRTHKQVKVFSDVAAVIHELPDRLKLWAYLGLNCGMTNADLGELHWDMIDKKNWTLTRRRVKTGENPNTPTVKYKLFPETIKLLKKIKTTGLVLQTQNNKPMYAVTDPNNRRKKKDMFSTIWGRLKDKPKITLSRFRSIGSTALKTDVKYRSYVTYFLAHSPSEVSDRHYAAESDGPFYEALAHIRKTVLLK